MHNALVIGNGGREHAIVLSLLRSPRVNNVFIINDGGAISQSSDRVVNIKDITSSNYNQILNLIEKHNIDLTIIGPEAPLSEGIVDFLENNNKKAFGPTQAGAMIESSKIFMKDVLIKAGVPTAKYKSFNASQKQEAFNFIDEFQSSNIVIKADGLAAGKGVVISRNIQEAKDTVIEFFNGKFGNSSHNIVIEEFLDGFEVSLFGISDGENVICFKSACDHKKIFEDDMGENTGGMGTFSPSFLSTSEEQNLTQTLIEPIVKELKSRGIIYRGVLFAGLMVCDGEIKVLEFNVRFGDPEAQSLLSLFEGDFYDLCEKSATGNLANFKPKFSSKSAVTVVCASKGYPQSSSKNNIITLPSALNKDEFIFHAGTKLQNNKFVTNGGRVLGITALGSTKAEARKKAYNIIDKIQFDGMQVRRDIAEDLVSFEINFEDNRWRSTGIGLYEFFQRLLKCTLKTHFSQNKSFTNDATKLYEFSILLTNDINIHKLNKIHRNKDKPTNVLSFPIKDEYTEGKILMGDIVLSLDILQKEALDQDKTFIEHLAHLFVHSILHLIGYNHEIKADMIEMENLEDIILNKVL